MYKTLYYYYYMNCFQYYLLDEPSLYSSFYKTKVYIKNVTSFFSGRLDHFLVCWSDDYLLEISSELNEKVFVGDDFPVVGDAFPPDVFVLIENAKLEEEFVSFSWIKE